MQRAEENGETSRTAIAVAASLVLHAAVAALLVGNFFSTTHKAVPVQMAITARVIDQSAIDRVHDRERRAEEDRKAQQQAEEDERQRQAEDTRLKKEAEDTARRAEHEKIEKQKAETVRREATAKKQRDDADKKRVADLTRKQKEVADKKKAEQVARAQAQRESELKAQLAEEQGAMQARKSGLYDQYLAMIEQQVYRHWNKPLSAKPGIQCEVKVRQAPGGTVLSVVIASCNGDQATRESIETAVMRASPLPSPPDSRLFDSNIRFNFHPLD